MLEKFYILKWKAKRAWSRLKCKLGLHWLSTHEPFASEEKGFSFNPNRYKCRRCGRYWYSR